MQETTRLRLFRITITSHRWSWKYLQKSGPWVQKLSSDALLFPGQVVEVRSPAGLVKKRGPFGSPLLAEVGSAGRDARYYVHFVHSGTFDPVEEIIIPAGMRRKGTVRVPFSGSKAGVAWTRAGDMYICTYHCHLRAHKVYSMYSHLLGGTSVHHTV